MRKPVSLALLMLSAPLQAQQAPPIGPHCVAALCEEGTIYAVAIDTLLRAQATASTLPPRVLRPLYLVPLAPLAGGSRGAALASFDDIGAGILEKYWPESRIVDSAEVVQSDGHTLRPGGALYVLGPIDWMGPDLARLQLAEYSRDMRWGVQYFVWLERGVRGWCPSRVAIGWQN
jgi:hypothetical protein